MFSFAKISTIACSLAGLFGSAFGTGIVVPLYVWPGDPNVCSGWTPLFNVISATPSLTFYVVINPNSGPGDPNTQPVDSYSTCIQQLKASESGSNLRVLGYVATGGGSSTTVVRDITTYAGWNAAYRPDGIFFDQGSTASSQVSTYAGWADQARQLLGSSTYTIVNPGQPPQDNAYFNSFDQIVTREDFLAQFSPSQLSITPTSPAAKQAVILTDAFTFPSSVVSQLVSGDHIGSLWVTDDTQANQQNPYDTLPSYLTAFVNAVVADN